MKKWHITPQSFRRGFVFFLKIGIVILTTLPFYYILTEVIKNPFPGRGTYFGMVLYAFLFVILGSPYEAFKLGILRVRELVFSYLITILLTNAIVYMILSLMTRELFDLMPMLIMTMLQIIVVALYYLFANNNYYKLYPSRDTILIHANSEYEKHIAYKFARREDRYHFTGIFTESDDIDKIKDAISQNNTCIIGQINYELRHELLNYCYQNDKRLFMMPTIDDIIMQNSHITQIGDSLLYLIKNRPISMEQLLIKRLIDISFSLLFLIMTSPILLVVALIIKLTDGGPVFFRQKRYTRNGDVFEILKFRSMIVDAEKDGAQFTTKNDSRITPIGKFIRKTRIDEIPQFINVLKGEMSVVGPRAERIENTDSYVKFFPEFIYRLKVKAGITGYAQIFGKYNTSPEDKARMDVHYIETFSILNDFKLMLTTFKIIFKDESTEGFSQSFLDDESKE